MAIAASTLISKVRRYVGDWPDLDQITAAVSTTSGTTVTVADTTRYAVNWYIQIDQELMRITALASGTNLTVVRGAQGTTAATHLINAPVLIRPQFSDLSILDALNAGIDATFPSFYKAVVDTSVTTDGSSYEYNVPAGLTWLSKLETKESGSPYFYRLDAWTVKRGSTPFIQFATPPIQGTLRCYGFGPFPNFTAVTDNLDAQWPAWDNGDLPVLYAASQLLMTAEAVRVRTDAGPQDDAQSPPRQGVISQTANMLLQRFQLRLASQPMPAMPRHVVRVL